MNDKSAIARTRERASEPSAVVSTYYWENLSILKSPTTTACPPTAPPHRSFYYPQQRSFFHESMATTRHGTNLIGEPHARGNEFIIYVVIIFPPSPIWRVSPSCHGQPTNSTRLDSTLLKPNHTAVSVLPSFRRLPTVPQVDSSESASAAVSQLFVDVVDVRLVRWKGA